MRVPPRRSEHGQEVVHVGVAEAYLGLDRDGHRKPAEALRWLCRTGRLKYTKVGRHLRFEEAWLDELIDRNAVRREATPRDLGAAGEAGG